MSEEPTPVSEDANATVAELHTRARTDYANGWGTPDPHTAKNDDDQ